jgi:hypothetical protein
MSLIWRGIASDFLRKNLGFMDAWKETETAGRRLLLNPRQRQADVNANMRLWGPLWSFAT